MKAKLVLFFLICISLTGCPNNPVTKCLEGSCPEYHCNGTFKNDGAADYDSYRTHTCKTCQVNRPPIKRKPIVWK